MGNQWLKIDPSAKQGREGEEGWFVVEGLRSVHR